MIYDEYESYVLQYKKEYGPRTIVLFECGSFYEIYNGAPDGNEPLVDMRAIGDLLNLQVSRRNKQIQEVSRTNFEMAGFPSHALKKFIDLLLASQYTVVLVQQTTAPPNPKRAVTDIYSPGTYLEAGNTTANHLAVLYIEENEGMRGTAPTLSIGGAWVDVVTGASYVFEATSVVRDTVYSLDEAYRLLMIYKPKEVLVMGQGVALSGVWPPAKIREYLELDRYYCHDFLDVDLDAGECKLAYQSEILRKVFPKTGLLSAVEHVGLERHPCALAAYVKMLQFTMQHNENLLAGVQPPKVIEAENSLVLSYNCAQQLDMGALIGLLNTCKTAIGRRAFQRRCLTPMSCAEDIAAAHRQVETCLPEGIHGGVREHLAKVYDLERLFRRWRLEVIHPHEVGSLLTSLEHVLAAAAIYQVPTPEGITAFIEKAQAVLAMDRLATYNRENMDAGLFREGAFPELDEAQGALDARVAELKALVAQFPEGSVRLEYTDKDGYFLATTAKRLTEARKSIEYFQLRGKAHSMKDWVVKTLTSSVKLTHPAMDRVNHEIASFQRTVVSMAGKAYGQFLASMHAVYEPWAAVLIDQVANMDYACANAFNARRWRLVCPEIVPSADTAAVSCEGLRHLLIEHCQPGVAYVTNDVTLHGSGMLLYGINSAGKSSLMKAIGLAVIMAQAGMYVPCLTMKLSPYTHVFTRIFSSDDISKGQSTFTKEILELRGILKRANAHSLVIGDELCSGTESISAISIVAAGICTLSERRTSFVFATHLHDLVDIPEVRAAPRLAVYHLSVAYDEATKKLVYNRKLQPGNGSTVYGIEVCRSLDLDPDFLHLANRIRQAYTHVNPALVSNDSFSSYNATVYKSICELCHEHPAAEVHHIKEQRTADDDGYIGTHHKNAKHNLVPLCEACHDRIHHGGLTVEGYIQTSEGVELKVSQAPTSSLLACPILKAFTEAQTQTIKFRTKKQLYDYIQERTGASHYKIRKALAAL